MHAMTNVWSGDHRSFGQDPICNKDEQISNSSMLVLP